MSRKGKIARLPKAVRDEINHRLQNGEPANRLVVWLNGLEPVKAVLNALFDGRPINDSNLSSWKTGGYVEWEQAQEVSKLVHQLQKNPAMLSGEFDKKKATECFTTILVVKLAQLSKLLLDKKNNPARQWKQFCKVHNELSRMRRDDYRSASLKWRR